MSALTSVAPRLGQLVRMLGSPVDGEIVAAAHAIGRTLNAAGSDWHGLADLIETGPASNVHGKHTTSPLPWTPSRVAAACAGLRRALTDDVLTDFETDFSMSILSAAASRTWRPSPKQAAILERILAKAERRS